MAKVNLMDALKSYFMFNSTPKRALIESPAASKPSLLKNLIVKAVGFSKKSYYKREIAQFPEYDFDEIRIAKETDSYIKITLDKTKRLIYKAGFYYKSENPECVEYLKTRFRIMSFAMKKPIDILFQEIADDLVDYSNCILAKVRVDKIIKDGSVPAKSQLAKKVVGGYIRLDLSTITIKRDQFGNIEKYIQAIEGDDDKEYLPEDIVHIYMNRDSNNAFGTPNVIAALEDVKLLRSLEGNVLALVHRFAMPIFHVKVGIPEIGMQATQPDIDKAQDEIEKMAVEGTLITNEKTEIKVVGAEGSAIDASAYLQYFENRVIAALDSSASQMGRGGAKQDADSMEGQLHDKVKYIQKVISIFVENYIIDEILLEGGFNPILNEKDVVNYVFNEINIESKIKVENHEMVKFQSGLQDRNETRKNIGYKEDIDDSQTYENIVDVPAKIEILKATYQNQGDMNMELAKFNAQTQIKLQQMSNETAIKTAKASAANKTTSSSSSSNAGKKVSGNTANGKTQTSKTSGAAKSMNTPSNQHGTTSAKVKESVDLDEKVIRDKSKHMKYYRDIYKSIDDLKDNLLVEDDCTIEMKFTNAYMEIINNLNPFVQNTLDSAIKKSKKDAEDMGKDVSTMSSMITDTTELRNLLSSSIKEVLNDIESDIMKEEVLTKQIIEDVFNKNLYRIRFSIEYVLPKMYWYTYAFFGRNVGITAAQVVFGNSDDKKDHEEIVDLLKFQYDDIPPFHPFCDCKLKYIEREGESDE